MAKIVEVQEVAVAVLKPYERNAKIHSGEQVQKIAESIKEFGFLSPCLIDREKNIIAGHGRVEAAKLLGMETVPCVFIEGLSDEQRRAYILADNKLTEMGEWDMDLVMSELTDLDAAGFDIEVTGFEIELEEEPIAADDNYEEHEDIQPRTKLGDIWQLGEHRLICGDSTDKIVVDNLMGGITADIAFTSPPYNVGKSATLNGNTHMTECKYESGEDDIEEDGYFELLSKSTENMISHSKWAFVNLQMLANNKRIICKYLFNYNDNLCDVAIWYKNSTAPAMAERVMNSQFEFVFIFSEENNSRAIGTNNFRGTVSNVYCGSAQRKNEYANIHSATFPIEFVSHYIKNFTNQKDAVIDLFGGTGTTLIACEQLNRKCFMCELDPHYCDVIIDRWETLTGQKAVLLDE